MQKEASSEILKTIAPILKLGGIGVVPTDTLYGLVGSALKKTTVERLYHVRRRDSKKPFIVLISSVNDLKLFGIRLNDLQKKSSEKMWPGKVSVVLSCRNKKFEYLHRGKKTLAFRVPNDEMLVKLLKKVGPLVAPSANRAGDEPALTFAQARKYFTDEIDFYVDGGKLKSKPSTLIEIDKQGGIQVLREGAVKIAKKPIMA